jgi:two-component system phosphate regulon sensor histidine kinase PhoR
VTASPTAADKAGVQLEFASHARLPSVALDPDAIVQVVLNLLDNAVKYRGQHGSRIRVTVRAAGGRVLIEVEDDGPGVPERERERVFEEFYRGDESLSSSIQGTGIGLALCRRIAIAHGGRVEVLRSRDLGGALFRMSLPAGRAPASRSIVAASGGA